jgi:NAD(P)-dependent dehydrogenase (short-subunit alcohol dehydrogenase family)
MRRLEHKRILVMGGTGGLGFSAAQAFVKEGASVCVVGRDAERVEEAKTQLGGNTLGIVGDAADPDTANEAVKLCGVHWDGLDGLYHVAGGSGRRFGDGPLDEITDDGWAQTIDLNLSSVLYSNRAVTRELMRQGLPGSILNCGSVLGSSPSPKFFTAQAYAAAKAGIEGLTRSAAATYATRNIRFNVLAPALVATPMSERAQGDEGIMDFVARKQPLDGGRIGRPGDLDGAAVFFMGDESRFVTGQVLSVDGGWTISDGLPE